VRIRVFCHGLADARRGESRAENSEAALDRSLPQEPERGSWGPWARRRASGHAAAQRYLRAGRRMERGGGGGQGDELRTAPGTDAVPTLFYTGTRTSALGGRHPTG
jgi:hypothetical protein